MRIKTICVLFGASYLSACAANIPDVYYSTERGCDGDLPVPPLTATQVELNKTNMVSMGSADALKTVDPIYPAWALQQDIEGWVQIAFDLTADGRVQNPSVIASEPGDMFDRAALDAITKWEFAPMLEDGQAVASTSQEQVMTFCTG